MVHTALRARNAPLLPNETCQSIVVALPSGVMVFFEYDETQEEIEKAVAVFLNSEQPHESFPFLFEDENLRLLPATDDGNAEAYGYVKIPVRPGTWTVSFLPMEYETVTILQPPYETT